jgi:hypothetical protein
VIAEKARFRAQVIKNDQVPFPGAQKDVIYKASNNIFFLPSLRDHIHVIGREFLGTELKSPKPRQTGLIDIKGGDAAKPAVAAGRQNEQPSFLLKNAPPGVDPFPSQEYAVASAPVQEVVPFGTQAVELSGVNKLYLQWHTILIIVTQIGA